MNKAILTGNLGTDVEVRYTQHGTAVANFRLATTDRYKDKDGNRQENTEWHRVVAFGRLGEVCGEFLNKGSKVSIVGKIQTRKWEDKHGNVRYLTEILASEMDIISGGRNLPAGSEELPEPPDDENVPF